MELTITKITVSYIPRPNVNPFYILKKEMKVKVFMWSSAWYYTQLFDWGWTLFYHLTSYLHRNTRQELQTCLRSAGRTGGAETGQRRTRPWFYVTVDRTETCNVSSNGIWLFATRSDNRQTAHSTTDSAHVFTYRCVHAETLATFHFLVQESSFLVHSPAAVCSAWSQKHHYTGVSDQ